MPRKNSAAIEGAGAATVALSGIHALIRIPLDQHRADKLKGLRTATLISGYRGSPLGGIDLTLEANPKLLSDHEIVFISGLNEDLGATAVMGSQLANLMDNKKYDGVCGMWYGKAPGVDRSGDAFKHANFAGVGLDRKIPLGEWVDPVFKGLVAARRLRGTGADPFGRTDERRTERALITEYRDLITEALATLSPDTHADAVELAATPDMIRGYDTVKLANVAKWRTRIAELGRA